MLLAHVLLGVDQEFSVASLHSFFSAGWPPGIFLLVQDFCWMFSGLRERPVNKGVLKSFGERIALVTAPHPFLFTAQGLCSERTRENLNSAETVVAFWPMEASEGI